MANVVTSGNVYQQMVVPAHYHYHQTQQSVMIPNVPQTNISVQKKEPKKRKKTPTTTEKALSVGRKKVASSITSILPNYVTGVPNAPRPNIKVDCSRCSSRRKCFRHINQKGRGTNAMLTCKTPEQTVVQLKQHMLKLMSGEPAPVCKSDPRTGVLTLDIAKMHRFYIQEHEPQALQSVMGESKSSYKPVVKQWLYRKILLDEFQSLDYLCCQQHLDSLRRALQDHTVQGTITNKKRKKKIKPQLQNNQPDYSCNTDRGVGGVLTTLHHSAPTQHTLHHTQSPHHTIPHYQLQPSPLIGVACPAMPAAPPVHSTPYVSSQVTSNILFGLGNQQQTTGTLQANVAGLQTLPGVQSNVSSLQGLHANPHQPPQVASPTQQHPLNLQTSQQQQTSDTTNTVSNSMHIGGHSHTLQPLTLSQSLTNSSSLPLNLHNPYYVSLTLMLPLHVPQHPPPHHHTQQYSMVPQQAIGGTTTFNHHAIYQ